MATIKASWPTPSAVNKGKLSLPSDCAHWQEMSYDREPKNIHVSKDIWDDVRRRYEMK